MKRSACALFCRICLFAVLSVPVSHAVAAQDPGAGRGARIAPPAAITCERNQLTSWTGSVTGYRRTQDCTWLEISTDADTVEQTTVPHGGSTDASSRFLLWGEPFGPSGWAAIESSPGQLKDGMRATAWICLDGITGPVVDWQPEHD